VGSSLKDELTSNRLNSYNTEQREQRKTRSCGNCLRWRKQKFAGREPDGLAPYQQKASARKYPKMRIMDVWMIKESSINSVNLPDAFCTEFLGFYAKFVAKVEIVKNDIVHQVYFAIPTYSILVDRIRV